MWYAFKTLPRTLGTCKDSIESLLKAWKKDVDVIKEVNPLLLRSSLLKIPTRGEFDRLLLWDSVRVEIPTLLLYTEYLLGSTN